MKKKICSDQDALFASILKDYVRSDFQDFESCFRIKGLSEANFEISLSVF